jgi:translocation and assembly module TamB
MRWRRVLAWCGGGVAALVLVLFLVLQTPAGMRGLGAVVSWAASTPQSRLEIAGLRGSFPTDLAADRIELADADGPWLRIEQARIDWTFAPVFSRRLAITSMSAARVTVLRPPLPSAEPTSSDRGDG